MTKPPIRLIGDHLTPNPRRKYGQQDGGLVECTAGRGHGFYPKNEYCPGCRDYMEMQAEKRQAPTQPSLAPVHVFKSAGEKYYEAMVVPALNRNGIDAAEWDDLTQWTKNDWQNEAEAVGFVDD